VAVMNNKDVLKGAYSQIDVLIQEVVAAEDGSMRGICAVLDRMCDLKDEKALRALSGEVLMVLRDWNKIPANQMLYKVRALEQKMIAT
jgi:hypothetical protein